ncbi:MAG: FoF1 ATP synthase subunit gamma [Amphiplicatus sp.]
MSALEQLLRRQKTAQDLQSVVGVMKSLSAVAVRRYEAVARATLGYHAAVTLGLQAVLRRAALKPREAAPSAAFSVYVIIGSDRGLCGRFNEGVVDLAEARLTAEKARGLVLTVGARVEARLQARGFASSMTTPVPSATEAIGETVETILMWLDEQREKHGIERVCVFYNRRAGDKLANAREETILPVFEERLVELRDQKWPSRSLPTFTAPADDLFSRLVRELVFLSFFTAIGESLASEHASRLAAMQRAERHIEEYLTTLGGEIREQRQNSITQQLLDIVGSFNVMKERENAIAS